jgi:hypothetical protein
MQKKFTNIQFPASRFCSDGAEADRWFGAAPPIETQGSGSIVFQRLFPLACPASSLRDGTKDSRRFPL